jgi:hypothetical protein
LSLSIGGTSSGGWLEKSTAVVVKGAFQTTFVVGFISVPGASVSAAAGATFIRLPD